MKLTHAEVDTSGSYVALEDATTALDCNTEKSRHMGIPRLLHLWEYQSKEVSDTPEELKRRKSHREPSLGQIFN